MLGMRGLLFNFSYKGILKGENIDFYTYFYRYT
jgi:hypothetical protein